MRIIFSSASVIVFFKLIIQTSGVEYLYHVYLILILMMPLRNGKIFYNYATFVFKTSVRGILKNKVSDARYACLDDYIKSAAASDTKFPVLSSSNMTLKRFFTSWYSTVDRSKAIWSM